MFYLFIIIHCQQNIQLYDRKKHTRRNTHTQHTATHTKEQTKPPEHRIKKSALNTS